MNNDDRRKLWEVINSVPDLRGYLLTADQLQILKLVQERGSITSSQLSHILKIPVSNASTRLITLMHKGWLKRVEITSRCWEFDYRLWEAEDEASV